MNIKTKKSYIIIGVFIVVAIAALVTIKVQTHYSSNNSPTDGYFESKYTNLKDAQKCIDEWHKYYPPKDGLEQTLTGIPCPGEAR